MKELIKNLDLRNMLPFKRHTKILEMWNSLKEGETLKIINDHEPRPLYYQFQAEYNGEFEWKYEKKGPKDWIFLIKRTKNEKKQQIKDLIKRLRTQKDINKLKENGKILLQNISPTDLALIEQEIINEGISRQEMRKLCDVHLEVMKDSLKSTKIKLNPGHPIHTLMEEHKMILDFIDKLQNTINKLKSAKGFKDVTKDTEMLEHIAEHLVEADKHYQREEEVLFPMLERFGVREPPEIMCEEHKDLKLRKNNLYKLAKESSKLSYSDFVKRIKEIAEYLIKELPNHIYKEDNILYPMALQIIPIEEWPEIKKKMDKIGYCCFTPNLDKR